MDLSNIITPNFSFNNKYIFVLQTYHTDDLILVFLEKRSVLNDLRKKYCCYLPSDVLVVEMPLSDRSETRKLRTQLINSLNYHTLYSL